MYFPASLGTDLFSPHLSVWNGTDSSTAQMQVVSLNDACQNRSVPCRAHVRNRASSRPCCSLWELDRGFACPRTGSVPHQLKNRVFCHCPILQEISAPSGLSQQDPMDCMEAKITEREQMDTSAFTVICARSSCYENGNASPKPSYLCLYRSVDSNSTTAARCWAKGLMDESSQ